MLTFEIFASCIEKRLADPTKDEIDIIALTYYDYYTRNTSIKGK